MAKTGECEADEKGGGGGIPYGKLHGDHQKKSGEKIGQVLTDRPAMLGTPLLRPERQNFKHNKRNDPAN